MSSNTEALALSITTDLYIYTVCTPGSFVMADVIAKRLRLTDDAAADAAIRHAVESGWLEAEGQKIRPTDEGTRRAVEY